MVDLSKDSESILNSYLVKYAGYRTNGEKRNKSFSELVLSSQQLIDMKKDNRRSLPNEVVDVNGSKVFIENGEVKTVFSEDIQQSGYMSLEDLRNILQAEINKQEELFTKGNCIG